MADKFNGKFVCDKSENFEEFLKAVGADVAMRKIASTVKPTCIITTDGTAWTIRQETPVKKFEIKFTLGEEFEETTPFGSKCQAIATMEDGKLVHKQLTDKKAEITREIDGDNNLKMTCKCGDVVATRLFKRQ